MTTTRTAADTTLGPTLAECIDDYRLSLHAGGKSRATREIYTLTMQYLDAFLAEQGMPRQVDALRREHVESWLVSLREKGRAPATVSVYYRSLQPFYKWAIEEGLVTESPLRNISRPKVPLQPVAVPTRAEIEKLVKACRPRKGDRDDFEGYRDTAIVTLFATTGIRRSEMAGLTVNDVKLNKKDGVGEIRVLGKGGRWRVDPFGILAAQPLSTYLKHRERHARANRTDALWLGYRGGLTADGIMQMLQRRGRQAGIDGLHPHLLRHYFNDRASRKGMSEGAIMQIAGWTTTAMPRRYASSTANARAHEEYHRLGIGDEL